MIRCHTAIKLPNNMHIFYEFGDSMQKLQCQQYFKVFENKFYSEVLIIVTYIIIVLLLIRFLAITFGKQIIHNLFI